MDEDIYVIPVSEIAGDRAKCWLVGDAKVLKCLIREHDTPPECVVRLVALEDRDVMRRIRLLEEQRRVESCRSAADDVDLALHSELARYQVHALDVRRLALEIVLDCSQSRFDLLTSDCIVDVDPRDHP